MTWGDILQDWHGQLDRLEAMFPHADTAALVRFRGNKHLLAEYIADTHDLTLAEGLEAVELRLLPGAATPAHFACAAE
ncbi:hypothetical protein [Tropicimonas marinistellae]|uniref:hypothetical protein n=1 Tax=Tropicimonas marinistellae TaxID=1739787 RepID=UPI00082AA545|nr:hypothetical protein [Tropicimonas marinistellae]